jgi:hypothetical protein
MTVEFTDAGELVEAALRRLGSRIVLGLPLGIGKPVAIANEFYRRVARPLIDHHDGTEPAKAFTDR